MNNRVTSAVARACWYSLIPVARLFVYFGISYREFADIARSAFVAAARKEILLSGKAVTAAGVSQKTGLSRKDIARILAEDRSTFELRFGSLLLTEIIADWGSRREYQNSLGEPVIMPENNESGPSLHGLISNRAPHASAKRVIEELMEYECIEAVPGGYRLLSRQFVPQRIEPRTVEQAGRAMFALGTTIVDNLSAHDSGKKFERMAVSANLPAPVIPRFIRQVSSYADSLLQIADDWIIANEEKEPASGQGNMTGIGIYVFDVDDIGYEDVLTSGYAGRGRQSNTTE